MRVAEAELTVVREALDALRERTPDGHALALAEYRVAMAARRLVRALAESAARTDTGGDAA